MTYVLLGCEQKLPRHLQIVSSTPQIRVQLPPSAGTVTLTRLRGPSRR
jgi:hypothetical protein